MFEVGDYIVYGNNGVCEVKKVGPIDSLNVSGNKLYYTLSPFYIRESLIYTPVDNENVVMRPVLTEEEAMLLIDDINNIGELSLTEENKKENEYKDIIKNCNCRELIKMIKTISIRKKQKDAEGKKLTGSDSKYIQIAEEHLYGELAISLDMDKDDVKKFIAKRVDKLTQN